MPAQPYTSYIRERIEQYGLSNAFPGSQKEYIASRNKGIVKARELINQGFSEDLFERCMSIFTEVRRNYAIKVGDKECNSFGVRRTSHFIAYCTALSDPRYFEYGVRMRRLLTTAVTNDLASHSFQSLQQPRLIRESTYESVTSTLNYRLISEDEIDNIASRVNRKTARGELSTDQYGRPCVTESYKMNNPDLYQEEQIQIAVDMLEKKIPCKRPVAPKTIHSYIFATSEFKHEHGYSGEMSNYLLRLDQDKDNLLSTPVIVIHQDSFLIPQTMKIIQSIFNEIVRSQRGKLKDKSILRNRLGMIRYLFAQATPLDRGSADCAGAIERALTPANDLKLLDRRDVKMEIDLEALTAESISAFMERYLKGWISPTPPSYI